MSDPCKKHVVMKFGPLTIRTSSNAIAFEYPGTQVLITGSDYQRLKDEINKHTIDASTSLEN